MSWSRLEPIRSFATRNAIEDDQRIRELKTALETISRVLGANLGWRTVAMRKAMEASIKICEEALKEKEKKAHT